MFSKLLKKVDQIKEEVFDQANKHMNDVTRNVREGVGDAVRGKTTDVFSSLVTKVSDAAASSADYLVQVQKMANEKKAMELGITSRELKGLSLNQIAEKYGMTVEEYQEKLNEEAKQYENGSFVNSIKNLKERTASEFQEREKQANQLNMTIQEFDELTLQEQADKLNITLEDLLTVRSLNF